MEGTCFFAGVQGAQEYRLDTQLVVDRKKYASLLYRHF